ncbi:hypothetical protein D9758_016644 [Tetrapyrgos nigripes]|uniref:Uncharacterized protein n=1 Tax=Tetrapyrgos nigripes TaxID=182062 RepID=A0A8H5CIC5_9AGAR|nr:hypothetical protein D9758_016644 [Tetrapyrgos nigripes]
MQYLADCSVLIVSAALAVTKTYSRQSKQEFPALMQQINQLVLDHEVNLKLHSILLSKSVEKLRSTSEQDFFPKEFIRICREQFTLLSEQLLKGEMTKT